MAKFLFEDFLGILLSISSIHGIRDKLCTISYKPQATTLGNYLFKKLQKDIQSSLYFTLVFATLGILFSMSKAQVFMWCHFSSPWIASFCISWGSVLLASFHWQRLRHLHFSKDIFNRLSIPAFLISLSSLIISRCFRKKSTVLPIIGLLYLWYFPLWPLQVFPIIFQWLNYDVLFCGAGPQRTSLCIVLRFWGLYVNILWANSGHFQSYFLKYFFLLTLFSSSEIPITHILECLTLYQTSQRLFHF